MEQRRLRLGDILDDYCPRERRVTNHAVVAMVEETVKQTRCTTCDAEHPYKGGQAPRRRKKEGPSALYKEVLAGKPDSPDSNNVPANDEAPEVLAAVDAAGEGDSADGDVNGNVMTGSDVPAPAVLSRPAPAVRREPPPEIAPAILDGGDERVPDPEARMPDPEARMPDPEARMPDPEARMPDSEARMPDPEARMPDPEARMPDPEARMPDPEDGPVHRQLIRATLPRIEGQKDERRPTDFTIRQSSGRGNNVGNQFRGGGGGNDRMRSGGRGGQGGNAGNTGHGANAGHRGNGHRPQGGPRFAGARPAGQGQGHGRGQGGGFRSVQQPRHGGGRKRSR